MLIDFFFSSYLKTFDVFKCSTFTSCLVDDQNSMMNSLQLVKTNAEGYGKLDTNLLYLDHIHNLA
jgi:hypothetical protein